MYLRDAGLPGVPEVLGFDESSREILSYLPGRSIDVDTEVASDSLLAQAVSWLHRFHELSGQYRPLGEIQWRTSREEIGPGQIVCHNDVGAYNWVVDGDAFIGMIDWDMCGPGQPIDELAFMAWNSVPLFDFLPDDDVVRRLRIMADSYGEASAIEILDHVPTRLRMAATRISAGQQAGDPGMLNLLKVGEPARMLAGLAILEDRIPRLRAALQAD